MMRFYKILRDIVVTLLVLAVLVPVSVYVAVSLPFVQDKIRDFATRELSKSLGVPIEIGKIDILPPNQVIVSDALICTPSGDTIANIGRLGAGINLNHLIFDNRIVVSYAAVSNMDARIWRDSISAPLNIQPIIDALSSKDKNKPKSKIDLAFNTVIIRQSRASYDVVEAPAAPLSTFDRNHIAVDHLRADISLPVVRNDMFHAQIKRMAFTERSGLKLQNLAADVQFDNVGLRITDFDMRLPASRLHLGDIELNWVDGKRNLRHAIINNPINLRIADSYITPSDLSPLLPQLAPLNHSLPIDIDIVGNLDHLQCRSLRIGSQSSPLWLNFVGDLRNLRCLDSVAVEIPTLKLTADAASVVDIARSFAHIPTHMAGKLSALGSVNLDAVVNGSGTHASGVVIASTALGDIVVNGDWSMPDSTTHHFDVIAESEGLSLGTLLGNDNLGELAFSVNADGVIGRHKRVAVVDALVPRVAFKGYDYNNLHLQANLDNDIIDFDMAIDDPNIDIALDGSADISQHSRGINASASINRLDPNALRLYDKFPGQFLRANIEADLHGHSINDIVGDLSVSNIRLGTDDKATIELDGLTIEAYNASAPQRMIISSDLLDAEIMGNFNFPTIGYDLVEILGHAIPALHDEHAHSAKHRHSSLANDFTYTITVKETGILDDIVRLPIEVLSPISIFGEIDAADNQLTINLDAPYLRQGNKLIEGTALTAVADGATQSTHLNFDTQVPTANGLMPVNLKCDGAADSISTRLQWVIQRKKKYNGDINLTTAIARNDDNQITATVDIEPSSMTFNDSVWTIQPATITYRPKDIDVDGFVVERAGQYVKIDGSATDSYTDLLAVDILNVNLDYIFESLGLDNVRLGGDATGTIHGSGIFTPAPALLTDNLHVDNISFNRAVLGNADIKSRWDNDRQAVNLDAVVHQPNNKLSYIRGDIFATRDSLDIRFDADDIDVAFLQPYMSAFCSNVGGRASGWARLWGNFKYIDLEGDIFADNVMLNIDFTNVQYWATDSVHIRPGRIDLNDIMLRDKYGHTARLNGFIKHTFFKQPVFDFHITEANNLLAYDVTEKINPDWFGHILGSGTASVSGKPGHVDISANMKSDPGSTFTFVLSDRLDASEYTFITFRDRDKLVNADREIVDDTPEIVKQFKARINRAQQSAPTDYDLAFDMEITPDLKMILVMDPEGGDKVVAHGSGNVFMGYNSQTEDLVMRGVYTLDRGNYNFTLQDIFRKDFIINPGSSITFRGDPYAAQLDLQAVYATKANLTDLDESFAEDKELNNTRVPVNALLNVSGDMRSPDLNFDLQFPTVTSDVYRKVKSIVSTDEMMNRQIIYLLALNRFYTPDYMANATRGSELVSVASSTLSSQLSSILGQLSDNWTISPNVRSALGDFSDVEFDLALSSQLLNNRLIFNGNLGYRDKTLNTNQFVGDFDIEYLLNRSGNVRLKAYNRYNDKNFYVKTATTTQGVGIIYRRDFDDILSFVKRLLHKSKKQNAAAPDSTSTTQPAPQAER